MKPKLRKRQRDLRNTAINIAIVAIALFFASKATRFNYSAILPAKLPSIADSNCVIKGNISISSGRKIYHLPGMKDYERTNIEPVHGERWFCSEKDAIAQGWQKAPK